MNLNVRLSTPEERKEQFEALKEHLQSGVHMPYDDIFKMLYEEYYFIARPTDEEKEILELLSQYEGYVEKYWDTIEMPVQEDNEEEDDEEDEEKLADYPLYKIADCIANGTPFVMLEVEECLADYIAYCEERDIEAEECEEIFMEICWSGLADSLIKNEYAIELEWNENAKALANKLAENKIIKRDSSLLNKGWFSEEDSIVDGCHILNKKWRGKGMCLGIMDIDSDNYSDSYVIFPCKLKELEMLKQWAEELGCWILSVGELED